MLFCIMLLMDVVLHILPVTYIVTGPMQLSLTCHWVQMYLLDHTIPYHTIPYHTVPYRTLPYHTMPYHTIPYHTMQNIQDHPSICKHEEKALYPTGLTAVTCLHVACTRHKHNAQSVLGLLVLQKQHCHWSRRQPQTYCLWQSVSRPAAL